MKPEKVKVNIKDTGGLFTKVDGVAIIIISSSGIEKQVDAYSRGGVIYAAISGGFVSLAKNKATSSQSYKWVEFVPLNNNTFEYIKPHFGYLELSDKG